MLELKNGLLDDARSDFVLDAHDLTVTDIHVDGDEFLLWHCLPKRQIRHSLECGVADHEFELETQNWNPQMTKIRKKT